MVKLLGSLALLAFTLASADAQPPAAPKAAAFDAAKMLGTWEYVSGMKAGEKVEKDHLVGKVKIDKDTLTIPSGQPQDFVMGYKVDPKTSPVNIDMEIKKSPMGEGGKAKGIVALEGDTLKICYHPTGGDRPKKFESTKDNGAFYFVLKKAAK